MENATVNQIQDRFRLEISLLRLEQQAEENQLALRQAKYGLRTAQQEQLLYSGSLRSFADRLSGKKEETETALRHAVQKAEANLSSAQQTGRRLDLQLSEVRARLGSLPDWESLRDQADSETRKVWHRLEALLSMEVLLPLLEVNHAALLEQRSMINGANVGKVYSYAEQADIGAAPEKAGKRCKPYLLRLKAALDALDIPFAPCAYFDDPTAFVNAVIAQHNRRDRLNEAINQVEAVQRLIPKLQKQLEN